MGSESTTGVGRRAMLTAGLAGMIAAVVGALGVPRRVAAGDGDSVVIGKVNVGQSATWLHTTNHDGFLSETDGGDALIGKCSADKKSGVFGSASVAGGFGVYGLHGPSGNAGALGSADNGVRGLSTGMNGVEGRSAGNGTSGVAGFTSNAGGWGVHGLHGPSGNWGALGNADKGVRGYSKGGGGVYGQSDSGEGVRGHCGTGDGVVGQSNGANKSGVYAYNTHKDGYGAYGANVPSGTFGYLGGKQFGVYGLGTGPAISGVMGEHSGGGWGVSGTNKATKCGGALGGPYGVGAIADAQHIALVVEGKVLLRLSGVLTVGSGKSSATQGSLAGGLLTPMSAVHATLQTNRAGLFVQAAVPNQANGTVTIYLNKKVAAATKVAWFVVERGAP